MSKDKIYSAAIIGTGRIGFFLGFDKKREQPASHTMAIKNNKRISLCAGCDTEPKTLDLWHKKNKKARIYNSSSELFSKETAILGKKIDIIIIAVNEESHFSVTKEAIEYGPKLIILEKPVALDVKEGEKILQLSQKHKVPILVNHERRFARDYALAKKLISNIGQIQSINASLSSGLRVYCEEEEKTGLYSLLHDGTHLVDIVLFLLEDVAGNAELKLENICGINVDEKNMIRNVTANYVSSQGINVSFVISGRSRFFGFEIDIRGTEGRLEIGNGFFRYWKNKESKLYTGFKSLTKTKVSLTLPDGKTVSANTEKFLNKTGYFSLMVQNAVDYLDGKSKLFSTVDNGLNTLKILEEIKNYLKEYLQNKKNNS